VFLVLGGRDGFFPFSVQFLLASATTREPQQVIKIALIAAISGSPARLESRLGQQR
jgi:hypothetical protein